MRSSSMTVRGEVVAVDRYESFPDPICVLTLEGADGAASKLTSIQDPMHIKNLLEIKLIGIWAARCSFIQKGFAVSISNFDVHPTTVSRTPIDDRKPIDTPLIGLQKIDHGTTLDTRGGHTPFVISPNDTSRIVVTTAVNIIVTAVGLTSESDINPADGIDEAAMLARSVIPVHLRTNVLNAYSSIGRYYDVIYAQKTFFAQHAAFVDRSIGNRRGVVLDIGCGTGALAFHLALSGSPVVGIDPSPTMERIVREKTITLLGSGEAGGSTGAASVRFISAAVDRPDFALETVTEAGADSVRGFGAILCLDVLSQLSGPSAVRMAMRNITLHALPGCVLLVSLLSMEHYGPLMNTLNQVAAHYSCDRSNLAVTAASVPSGYLDVVSRVFVAPSPPGEHGVVVTTELTVMSCHPHSEKRTGMAMERVIERAYDTAFFESLAEEFGWRIRDVFCSVTGEVDGLKSANSSGGPRRVYLLQFRE